MRLLRLLAVFLLSGCATEVNENGTGPESLDAGGAAASAGGGSGGKSAGGGGSKSTVSAGGNGGNSSSGGTSSRGGTSSSGGKASSAGSSGQAGESSGGSFGTSSGGSSAGGMDNGSAGAGDGVCDQASAQLLSAMQSLITLDADACLKIEFSADQKEWVHSVTIQPNVASYPFPFSWSNCATEGSGSFSANYGNQVLTPVDPACPLLIQLGGPGQIELQWWAS